MGIHAETIAALPLAKALQSSAGRDGLQQTDVDQLVATVWRAADVAGDLLSRIPQTFRHYTGHDIGHSRNLIDLMGRFIPPATLERLNALEITFLLLSALLHDFGMFVSDQEKTDALKSDAYKNFLSLQPDRAAELLDATNRGHTLEVIYLQDALLAEFFRRIHPERAAVQIATVFNDTLRFRDIDIAPYVARLCESHGWGVFESMQARAPEKTVRALKTQQPFYGVNVNLQYIACCLRLADIMDFDQSRTPVAVFRSLSFTSEKSWLEWNKHLQVKGWVITPNDVVFAAECSEPVFYIAVMEFIDYIDAELKDCRKLLVAHELAKLEGKYQFSLPVAVDRSQIEMRDKQYVAGGFRFELDYERIMALLMDRSLYPDRSLFVRELLQNAVDACRYMQALAAEHGAPYAAKIVVRDHSKDPVNPRIVVEDNGVGMSFTILRNYFMRVGRSYYRSAEFTSDKTRLQQQGIHLDATSQFGIGILSCFMAGDRFEVETYRIGSQPLHVTVEGPTKYFLIRTLDEPKPQPFVRYDGPPNGPGTRVTVHVTGTEIDVAQVVQTMGVNLEFDVIVERDGQEPVTIEANGWSRVDFHTFPETFAERRSRHDGWVDELSENLVNPQTIASDIIDVLHMELVPLGDGALAAFRGSAWLTLLNDPRGEPVPARGFLRVEGPGVRITGVARQFHELLKLLPRGGRQRIAWLEASAAGGVLVPELLKAIREMHQKQVRRGEQEVETAQGLWRLFRPEQRKFFCAFAAHPSDTRLPWYEIEGVAQSLLRGTFDWVVRPVTLREILNLSGLPQRYALHGILLPAGIVKWDPMAGSGKRLSAINGGGGMAIDFRGPAAPRPAASRLFVLAEDSAGALVPIARAIIRHVMQLIQVKVASPWVEWGRELLEANVALSHWYAAAYHELELLESLPIFRETWGSDGKSAAELRQQFGRYAPVACFRSGWRGLAALCSSFHPVVTQDGKKFVDLDTRLPAPALTFDRLSLSEWWAPIEKRLKD